MHCVLSSPDVPLAPGQGKGRKRERTSVMDDQAAMYRPQGDQERSARSEVGSGSVMLYMSSPSALREREVRRGTDLDQRPFSRC